MKARNNRLRQVVLSSLGQSWPVLLVALTVFSFGVFFGAIGVDTLSHQQVERLSSAIDNLLAGPPEELYSSGRVTAWQTLRDNFTTWVIIYFLGLTVIGIPFILVILFMRGFAVGFTLYFLAKQKPGTGILLAAVAMAPHNILYIPALLISGVVALAFCLVLLQRFFNSRLRVLPGFLSYTVIMLVTGAASMLAALIEVYVTPWLTRTAVNLLNGDWPLPFF